MKIIVIGLGSMGKRRIRLISEHKDVELFGIDSQEARCAEVKEKFGITCYTTFSCKHYQGVLGTQSARFHRDQSCSRWL
jgi:predicted dehydrogenase